MSVCPPYPILYLEDGQLNDLAHRLLGALGLAVYLSPAWESSLQSLLEVLSAKATIEAKAKTYKKKEVKKLADEITIKICV